MAPARAAAVPALRHRHAGGPARRRWLPAERPPASLPDGGVTDPAATFNKSAKETTWTKPSAGSPPSTPCAVEAARGPPPVPPKPGRLPAARLARRPCRQSRAAAAVGGMTFGAAPPPGPPGGTFGPPPTTTAATAELVDPTRRPARRRRPSPRRRAGGGGRERGGDAPRRTPSR